MAKWTIAAKRADFKEISARFGIDQVIARLIRNRDVVGDREIEKYLNGSVADFYSPFLMKDLEKAVDIIIGKIEEHKSVRIIGDYDIDGVMSTYILINALRRAGASVDYAIPERIKDGYGINENLVNTASEAGIDTIITCDNGIAAVDQIAHAKALGMTVVITDHHNIPFEEKDGVKEYIIPEADAVVDPKQESCSYPFKELCGAAVAWKFVCLLYEKLDIDKNEALAFLEFAAFATIGDVVPLKDENRIIVKEGMKALRKTEHKGLTALMEKCEISKQSVDTFDIGYRLGPCINACGRLDKADRALDLMLSDSRESAIVAAKELKELNDSRKSMTETGAEMAYREVEEEYSGDNVLVIALSDIHESLAGIIAGRVKEKYNKPAFVFAESDGMLKGSGRSIEAYNMFDELSKVKSLFERFGGHEMAAGITLKKENIDEFRRVINENCTLTEEDLEPKVALDMVVPLGYISEKLIDEFELLKPFGTGNKEPLFGEKNLTVMSKKIVGKNKNVLQLKLSDENGRVFDGICFRNGVGLYDYLVDKNTISIAYCPTINEFRGKRNINIVISDWI